MPPPLGKERAGETPRKSPGDIRETLAVPPLPRAGETPALLPPQRAGETPAPRQAGVAPAVNFGPVVAVMDDSAAALQAGGKAVAEAAKRITKSAQDRNEEILAALGALMVRDDDLSAQLKAIQEKLKYGPS